jgi:hypothetical protein
MSRKPLFDLQDPWFIPLWRRLVVTAVCLFGVATEVWFAGDSFWLILWGALSAYCIYSFFIAFNPRPPEDPKP